MGYETRFEVYIKDENGKFLKFKEFATQVKDAQKFHTYSQQELDRFKDEYVKQMRAAYERVKKLPEHAMDNLLYACGGEPTKWYWHEDDCRALSKAFPGYLFEIRGAGEEAGDLWVRYYRDGKMQLSKVQVTFEPFDEKLLK